MHVLKFEYWQISLRIYIVETAYKRAGYPVGLLDYRDYPSTHQQWSSAGICRVSGPESILPVQWPYPPRAACRKAAFSLSSSRKYREPYQRPRALWNPGSGTPAGTMLPGNSGTCWKTAKQGCYLHLCAPFRSILITAKLFRSPTGGILWISSRTDHCCDSRVVILRNDCATNPAAMLFSFARQSGRLSQSSEESSMNTALTETLIPQSYWRTAVGRF